VGTGWGRGGLALVLTLVVGVALGVVAGVGLFRGETAAGPARDVAAADGGPGLVEPTPLPSGSPIPVAAATSPEAAVTGFLAAEARGDFAASYAFLSAPDRVQWPTAAAWVAAHADLPPVTGFAVEEVRADAVVTATSLASRVDPVLGLVPARATGTWPTVAEVGGQRVRFAASTLQPSYPSDEGVAEAVRRWASARVDCRTEAQAEGSLLGSPALADQLCGAEGTLDVGTAGPLVEDERVTPLLDAFGPEVFTWARTVDVLGPVPLTAVAGPVGDAWVVVAVLQSNT
jgi:hypothetical protein